MRSRSKCLQIHKVLAKIGFKSSLKKMVKMVRRSKHLDTILLENSNNRCTKFVLIAAAAGLWCLLIAS